MTWRRRSSSLRTPAAGIVDGRRKPGASTPRMNGCGAGRKIGLRRSILQASALEPGIEAPRTGAREGDVKEDEAVKNRVITVVKDRKEAPRKMAEEISERHLARHDEGRRPREQAGEHQQTADEFDHTREPVNREGRRCRQRGREAEQA